MLDQKKNHEFEASRLNVFKLIMYERTKFVE